MCLHKTDTKPILNSCAIYKFYEFYVNKSNRYALHFMQFYSSTANFMIKDHNRRSSHTFYYFNILGGVKLANVVSTTGCIYICPVSSNVAQTTSWSDLSDRI